MWTLRRSARPRPPPAGRPCRQLVLDCGSGGEAHRRPAARRGSLRQRASVRAASDRGCNRRTESAPGGSFGIQVDQKWRASGAKIKIPQETPRSKMLQSARVRGSAAHTEVTNEGSAANLGNWSGRRSQCRSNGFGADNGRAQDCLSAEIKWGPAPPSIPPGAQAAVLYGDPGKEGLFSLRLKLPKDYAIPPHTHPKPEVVTVIS